MSETPLLFQTRDYRGATIEDLNIPLAVSINPTTSIYEAIGIAFENEFTYLPVIHERTKRLLGVINIGELKSNGNKLKEVYLPIVKSYMIWFNQSAKRKYEQENKKVLSSNRTAPKTTILKPRGKRYEVLTPMTPLEVGRIFQPGKLFCYSYQWSW